MPNSEHRAAPEGITLNSPSGWFQIQHETKIFSHASGFVILACATASMPSMAAAAYIALGIAFKLENSAPRFAFTLLLMPPGATADHQRANTITAIQTQAERDGASQEIIALLPWMCETRALLTLEGAHLVEVVGGLPQNSACVIFRPDLYRFTDLILPRKEDRPWTTDEISHQHIERLLRELAPVAERNNLMLILLCAEGTFDENLSLPDESHFVTMAPRSSESSDVDVARFIEVFRTGGWSAVKGHAEYEETCEVRLALALFEAFGMERNLSLAWAAMEPHALQEDWPPGTLLAMAGAARLAGNSESSRQLLQRAAAHHLQSAEDLFAAVQLAESNGTTDLLERLTIQLKRTFPENRYTEIVEQRRLFRERDFASSLRRAEKLELPAEAAQCRAFLAPAIQAQDFLVEMEKRGELEDGLISCADEALYRQYPCQAISFARRIPPEHALFDRACLIRFRALGSVFRKGARFFAIDELESLTRIVAVRPTNSPLLTALEGVLDFGLEEPLVKVVLSVIVTELLTKQSLRDEASIAVSRAALSSLDRTAGAHSEEEFAQFVEGFQSSLIANAGERNLIGVGTLDPSLRPLVGRTMIRVMALSVVNEGIREDLDSAAFFMHAICLACREIGDPDTDFEVLQSVIEYQATVGAAQTSRDLAAHALEFWPPSQPPYLKWRISSGWACLAEACLRSQNNLAALRYLALSLLAHDEPALNIELLRRRYRMAARIFRNLGLVPVAIQCIAFERELLDRINHTGQDISLEVLELQILLHAVEELSVESRLELLHRCQTLLQHGVESESIPLTAIQANLLRFLPPSQVPEDIMTDFNQRLESLPEHLKGLLANVANPVPSKESVAAMLEALPYAQSHDYLGHQIASALPAFSNALSHAVESGDSDLFFLAAGAFAQPSLSVRTSTTSTADTPVESTSFLRTTTREGLASGRLEPIPQFSFSRLATITLQEFQACLGASETAAIVAGEAGSPPAILLVTRESISEPRQLRSWSVDAFHAWRASYKTEFYWKEPRGYLPGIDSLIPPVRDVRRIVADLSLELADLPPRLTILPASHLFGFTWTLSPQGGGFLCEGTSLAVAPSAAWLVAARTLHWSGSSSRKAWIGSAATTNPTLIKLRDYVGDCLAEHQFVTSVESAPFGFSGCELAFIGAHGRTGMGDYFHSVGDQVNHFSPNELAKMLAGCGCVILAVCSGGRSDRQSGSEETLGLVAELFRAGVRCVLAPPWPIDIDVVKHWLPAFLLSLASGEDVGVAVTHAKDAVKGCLDHPCAWGQMHLYGDSSYRLTTDAGSHESPA